MNISARLLMGVAMTSILFITSCQKKGCTDSVSPDYDPEAKKEDGSCTFYYGGRIFGQIDVGSEVDLNAEFDVYIDGISVGHLAYYFPSGLSCGNTQAVGGVYESGSHTVTAVATGGSPVREGSVYLDMQECKVVLIENLQIVGGGGGAGYNCVSGSCGYVGSNADYASLAACQSACGGGGNCPYTQFSGTDGCDPGYDPVTSTLCCPTSSPYYCSQTNSCYTTCEDADAACTSVQVVKADPTGGGGGSAGYNCVAGSCGYVSSGASYATLTDCQNSCGGGGSAGYNCVGGSCGYVSSGASYSTLTDCENNCGGGSTGDLTFWCIQDLGCGNIYVTLTSYGSGTVSAYYNSDPGCQSSGCANFNSLGYGAYTYTATSDGGCTWNGNIQISGSCNMLQLTL